jgi:protein TonB
LKLKFYIIASIVSHLLLLGFINLLPPVEDTTSSVFDVNIVTPEERKILPAPEPLEPVIKKRKQPLIKRRPSPPESALPPESLYGKGTEEYEEDSDSAKHSESPGRAEDKTAYKRDDTSSFPPSEGQGIPLQPGKGDSFLAPPSYLFDKGTIEKFARKGTPAEKGLTFDTSDFKHRGYMRMLKERIESIWKYPKEAARERISGDLYMKFSIKKDGKLAEVELLRTSGYRELDEAAMNAVKKAQPFWPLPDDWDKDTLEIKGHFIYVFGNTLVL